MTKQDFKTKYFTNNFYWVDVDNYEELQRIGIELGCLNPVSESTPIEWHDEFKNLGFRTYDSSKPTKFQKECFLCEGENSTSYEEMLNQYKDLK